MGCDYHTQKGKKQNKTKKKKKKSNEGDFFFFFLGSYGSINEQNKQKRNSDNYASNNTDHKTKVNISPQTDYQNT